jgi:CelD/BcsL family acetyltransferase involved in cellulose biosynthesis
MASDTAQLATKPRADTARTPAPVATPALPPLDSLDLAAWQALADRAAEPNGYFLPDWELAVNALTRGRGDTLALCGWDTAASPARLVALLPVIPALRAFRLPFPALVSGDPYGVLSTPLLDGTNADAAADALLEAARATGAHALMLRDTVIDGPALQAFGNSLARHGLAPRVLHRYARAALDATRDAETLLADALGAKKLKELRRQHHRLADHGAVRFDVSRQPDAVARALEVFLALEASGWKARRGTAMAQIPGDAAFMRRATVALAARGACEIVTLTAGTAPVAAGVVLRHRDRAFWFKLGIDERFAKFSPGVQLALEITRHLCADPDIRFADSTATPDHPMINPIWRARLNMGDVLIPLRAHDPVVTLFAAALQARRHARDGARHVVHALRRLRKR